MASKLTIDSILFRMYEEARRMYCENDPKDFSRLTPIMRDRPIFYYTSWKDARVIYVKYDEFSFFINKILGLSTQDRIITERWKQMIKYGYLVQKGTSGSYALQLDHVRPLFGVENPSYEENEVKE